MLAWLKKHWLAFLGLVGAMIFMLSRRSNTGSTKVIKTIDDARRDEANALEQVRNDQVTATIVNDEKLAKDLDDIDAKHAESLKDLTVRDVAKANQLANDPDKLVSEISNSLGFKVIEPKE